MDIQSNLYVRGRAALHCGLEGAVEACYVFARERRADFILVEQSRRECSFGDGQAMRGGHAERG